MNQVELSPLGKSTLYTDTYSPTLLYPIPRAENRKTLGVGAEAALPFSGVDIWNCYELSWLLPSGKPVVMLAEVTVPADSKNIIESKSFKLYLNSFNQTVFTSSNEVRVCLEKDLSQTAGLPVKVTLYDLNALTTYQVIPVHGVCIDDLDIEVKQYNAPSLNMLKVMPKKQGVVRESLYSNLLKSNCPVTGQPDWGSVFITYEAHQKLEAASLLQYIVSFRQHADFHEHCIERIFMDLCTLLKPSVLEVYARYTRRGGLDINPYRSLNETTYKNQRLIRQ